MQAVLSAPGRAFVIETETVSTPGMADEVMNGTEPIERATKLAAEEGMKALSNGRGRGDLQSLIGAHRTDELFVAFIGSDTTSEYHSYRPMVGMSSEEGVQVIRFHLKLPVRLNHLGIAMSASGV